MDRCLSSYRLFRCGSKAKEGRGENGKCLLVSKVGGSVKDVKYFYFFSGLKDPD